VTSAPAHRASVPLDEVGGVVMVGVELRNTKDDDNKGKVAFGNCVCRGNTW